MKHVKKSWLALALALALALSLCACGKQAEADKPLEVTPPAQEEQKPAEDTAETDTSAEPEQPETPAEEPETPTEEPVEDISGIAGDADAAWYEADAGEGEYTDGVGNTNSYSYAYPAFNVDSADASAMNAEIERICGGYADEMQENETNKTSLTACKVSYQAYVNGSIVSFLIEVDTTFDYTEYYTYNLDVSTGNKAAGEALAAAAGMTEDEVIEKAQTAASDKFKELYGTAEGEDFYQEQYNKTMSADAYSMTMPMFLDGKGELCFVARIYAMAGAESYDYVLTLTK